MKQYDGDEHGSSGIELLDVFTSLMREAESYSFFDVLRLSSFGSVQAFRAAFNKLQEKEVLLAGSFIDLRINPLKRVYSYAVPDPEALRCVVEACSHAHSIIEFGAGTGYWAHLLQREAQTQGMDLDVVALDLIPPICSVSPSGDIGPQVSSKEREGVNGYHSIGMPVENGNEEGLQHSGTFFEVLEGGKNITRGVG